MSFLNKLEDFFVQIIRLVLLVFALVVFLAIGAWMINKILPDKGHSDAPESTILWEQVQPDLQFVLEETGRDMGIAHMPPALEQQLRDPVLRPAFQKADQLFRDFVAQQAQQHARIEWENDARGLAPLPALLQDNVAPAEQQPPALEKQAPAAEEASNPAAAEAEAVDAAAAAADEAAETCCYTEPVDVAQVLHERATQTLHEYGDSGYRAYVLGAPAALERVLSDQSLAPQLHELPIARLVDMVLTNYSISFSRAVSEQNDRSDRSDWWEASFSSLELTLWSVILSFLVLVVFVVMTIRIEKHLHRLSQQPLPPHH